MGADAGGVRVGGKERLAERVLMGPRRGKLRRLAGAGEGEAGDGPRQFSGRKSGLAEALNGDFIDGSKAASKAEPQIRGARYPFAEDFARERAQARTAARAAAIHPEEEHIRVHVQVPSLSSIGPGTYKN
jgi:hypothetical protein